MRTSGKGHGLTRSVTGLTLVVGIAGLMLAATASAASLNNGFDANNQGWSQTQDGVSNFVAAGFGATGGNPGGHLTATDSGGESGCATQSNPCNLLYFFSPQNIPGMAANYGGTGSFDLRYSINTGQIFAAELLLLPAGSVYLDALIPETSGTTYHHLSVPITEEADLGNGPAWAVCPYSGGTCTKTNKGQFKNLLETVDQIAVMADVRDGTGEVYELDNVSLTDGSPAPAMPVKHKKKKCKKKKKHHRAAVSKKCKKKKKNRSVAPLRLRG